MIDTRVENFAELQNPGLLQDAVCRKGKEFSRYVSCESVVSVVPAHTWVSAGVSRCLQGLLMTHQRHSDLLLLLCLDVTGS